MARYADKDVLQSGFLQGEDVIAGKAAILDVPYYTTTVAFKPVVAHGHNARLGTAATLDQKLQAGCWLSTAAVNELNIHLDSGNNLITGSRAALYGVG